MRNCYKTILRGCKVFPWKKRCFRKRFLVVVCNVMSSVSEIPVMTFAVAVLDQLTAYHDLIHELKQYQNQRAIIFGRHNVTRKTSVNGNEFDWGPPRCSGWEPCEEGLRELGWFSSSPQCPWGGHQGDGARLFAAVPGGKMRDNEHKLKKRDIQTGYKENLCSHEDREALEQAAWQGQTISILEAFQAPTGYSPEQASLTSESTLLWAGGWARDLLRPLPAWIFHDPVICTLIRAGYSRF